MTKKELIINYINDDANDKQIEFIYNLVSLPTYCNKLDLLKLAGKEKKEMNFDSAIPITYYKQLEEQYSNIKLSNLIYVYTDNWQGKLLNINDVLTANILNLKK